MAKRYPTPAELGSAPASHVGSTEGHPVATEAAPGFQSAADKAKINTALTGISVKDYGAVGDGVTDDILAIQRAVDAAVPIAAKVFFPAPSYSISAPIKVVQADTDIRGFAFDGMGRTKLIQETNNVPVIDIGGKNPSKFDIKGFDIQHRNLQPPANTEGCGILFTGEQKTGGYVGTTNFTIRDCEFEFSFRGITQRRGDALSRPVWGGHFDNLRAGYGLQGALIWLADEANSGQPNNTLSNTYIRRNDALTDQEPSLFFLQNSLQMSNVEINGGKNRAVFIKSTKTCSIDNLRFEQCGIDAYKELINITTSQIDIRGIGFHFCHFKGNGPAPLMRIGYDSDITMSGVVANQCDAEAGTTPYFVDGDSYGSPLRSLELRNYDLQPLIPKFGGVQTWIANGLVWDSKNAVKSVDGITGNVDLSQKYAALVHKTSHATGGADALAASDIDAAPRLAPAPNLMPDSGRYGGKQNPMALTTAGAYANLGWLSGFNGTTDAEIGKFIHNNTTNGGTAGALTQSVIDLLAAMGRTSVAARYGAEFRVSKYTMGTGTVAPLTTNGVTRYLATTNGARAMFGPGSLNTFAAWIRCTTASVMFLRSALTGLGGVVRTELDGVEQASDIILTPADGWKHVLVLAKTFAGYDGAHPYIYAETSATFEVACPYFAAGEVNLDWRNDHSAPLPTLNELVA